ncbi:hypothetical protein LJR129_004898 [Acidovorax sp. LjRoot129]|uniref:hypothetical protein n=1 Tax=unclassified Acidovorax TaxID=2684926 RepID=UPI003ECF5DCA
MKQGSLKVVVAITEAYPTLIFALGQVPEGVRSERLRILALLGLQVENGSVVVSAPVSVKTADAELMASGQPLKFAVVLNAAQPRLYAEIEATPSRFRAERLRSLAAIGWQIESGGLVTSAASVNPHPTKTPHVQIAESKQRELPQRKVETPSVVVPSSASLSGENAALAQSSGEGREKEMDANAVGSKVRKFAKLLGGLD